MVNFDLHGHSNCALLVIMQDTGIATFDAAVTFQETYAKYPRQATFVA